MQVKAVNGYPGTRVVGLGHPNPMRGHILLMYYKQAAMFIKPSVSSCWVPVFDGMVALR